MDERFWDDRYREKPQVFSGNPNPVLVIEAAELTPGHALDVGCGEGADAIWLAQQGWQVTAIDIAPTALERGAATAAELGLTDRITWTHSDLSSAPPKGSFDLVSMHYFPLIREPEHEALRGLIDAVAAGGTLLVTSHDLADIRAHDDSEFDHANFYQPADIANLLDGWDITVNETRDRTTPGPPGTHHVHDIVLRAVR